MIAKAGELSTSPHAFFADQFNNADAAAGTHPGGGDVEQSGHQLDAFVQSSAPPSASPVSRRPCAARAARSTSPPSNRRSRLSVRRRAGAHRIEAWDLVRATDLAA